MIGDHRNDENLLVAQTHLAMLKFHNKVCDMLSRRGKPAGDDLRGSARDRDLALSMDGAARLRRTHHRERHRREDLCRRPQILPLQEDTLHAGRVLRGGLSPRAQHGPRALQPQPRFHAGGGGCDARSPVSVHRPVRRHRRRPCAEPPPGPMPFRSCPATGSSTGAASTIGDQRMRPAFPSTPRARSIRSSSRAAHAARRRRQPAVPQSQARRQSRPALRPGRRKGA